MSEYNEWHLTHTTDDDINTPWHHFVKSKLTSGDIVDRKILEIGCGRGGFSKYLSAITPIAQQIVAADFSTSALVIAGAKYQNLKIDWKQEDIMNISFQDNFFDTVISCETIEHVTNPNKAVKELYRVLKPGGKLFLTCPNYFNLFGIWCLYRWIIGKPFTEGGQPYVNYILFPSVFFWVRQAGFKVECFQSVEITLPAKVPKHFWVKKAPYLLKPFGHRTFYVLIK